MADAQKFEKSFPEGPSDKVALEKVKDVLVERMEFQRKEPQGGRIQ